MIAACLLCEVSRLGLVLQGRSGGRGLVSGGGLGDEVDIGQGVLFWGLEQIYAFGREVSAGDWGVGRDRGFWGRSFLNTHRRFNFRI
jgi:hypothetical protein